MKKTTTWQSIQAEVMDRIRRKTWPAGELIPGEVDLAEEFGCARATVNRALRELAKAGHLERRRKGGTRVAKHPVRKATLDISITRLDIEQRGARYAHKILKQAITAPPQAVSDRMHAHYETNMLHIITLHLADGRPFMLEDRWVNIETVPDITSVDFTAANINEWLVENALFTQGNIAFSAASASKREADILACKAGDALFITDRTTWHDERSITSVRLAYAPGFQMQTQI